MLITNVSTAFTVNNIRISSSVVTSSSTSKTLFKSALFNTDTENDTPSSTDEATKKSLEDKMKEWEASEEEIKAASLGGVTPGRADGFDIGLFLAFPFIVGSALFFAVFPFIMDKIDVSSVGPPPTV